MAVTRLIPLHINKGKTIAQCLTDRLEYGKNGRKPKTENISVPMSAIPGLQMKNSFLQNDSIFILPGEKQEKDVIAYQIRQSFKPEKSRPRKRMRSAMNWQSVLQKGVMHLS